MASTFTQNIDSGAESDRGNLALTNSHEDANGETTAISKPNRGKLSFAPPPKLDLKGLHIHAGEDSFGSCKGR